MPYVRESDSDTRRHSKSTGQTYFYSAKKGKGYIVRTAMPYSVSLDEFLSADYTFYGL